MGFERSCKVTEVATLVYLEIHFSKKQTLELTKSKVGVPQVAGYPPLINTIYTGLATDSDNREITTGTRME